MDGAPPIVQTLPRHLARFDAAAVKALVPGQYLTFVEHPGLRLIAGKKSRSWIYRFRSGSSLAQVKVGAWPSVSYQKAAATWEDLRRARGRGEDPAVARREKRHRASAERAKAQVRAYLVSDLVEHYLVEYIDHHRAPRGAAEVRRMLEKVFVHKFGTLPAVAVSRSDAGAFLAELAVRVPSAARQGRREMAAAFDHAILRQRLPDTAANPWALAARDPSLRKLTRAGRRSRFLTDAEIALLHAWLPKSGISRTVRDLLELVLMTGARSGEAASMRWADVDLKRGTWSLPRTKTDQPRTIRLPRQAVALLEARAGLNAEFVFGRPDGIRAIRQHAVVWALSFKRKDSGLEHFTAHDLRRTVRTGLSRLRCPHEVAEAAMGHVKGGLAAVYDLHRHEAEVGEWLQTWCDHLDALAVPDVAPGDSGKQAD